MTLPPVEGGHYKLYQNPTHDSPIDDLPRLNSDGSSYLNNNIGLFNMF